MFRQFFYGRYGQDQLGRFMIVFALVLYIIMMFFRHNILVGNILWGAALLVLGLAILRMFSRNFNARQKENALYLRLQGKVLGLFGKKQQGGYNSYRGTGANGYDRQGGYDPYGGSYGGGYHQQGSYGGYNQYEQTANAKKARRNPTFEERRQYKYFHCNQCGQRLRVPRGKGRLRVTCTRCGNRFETRS